MSENQEITLIERRVWAAACDAAVVGLCCLAIFHSFNPLAEGPHPEIWQVAAAVLVLESAVEMLTGVTPGKWLLGLTLRRPDGTRPAAWRLALRWAVRLLPVGLFLLSPLAPSPNTYLIALFAALTLLICYVPACYISLMHSGTTLFDSVADTILVRGDRLGGKQSSDQPSAPVA